MWSLEYVEIGFEGSLESNEMICLSSPCPRDVPGCREQQFHCSCLGFSVNLFMPGDPSCGKQRKLGSSFDSVLLLIQFWPS